MIKRIEIESWKNIQITSKIVDNCYGNSLKIDGINGLTKYAILTFRFRMTEYTINELVYETRNYPCVSFIREMIMSKKKLFEELSALNISLQKNSLFYYFLIQNFLPVSNLNFNDFFYIFLFCKQNLFHFIFPYSGISIRSTSLIFIIYWF